MRIVSWNTNNRAADEHLLSLEPDVAVLPEWGTLPLRSPTRASGHVDVGVAGKRGIAVAAWGEWSVRAADVEPLPDGVVGAVDVSGPTPFKLIAVWPYLNDPLPKNPVTKALELWADWYTGHPLVVAGDFNTGSAWRDYPVYKDHPPLVARLAETGLRSAYHHFHGVEQGIDEATTFMSSRKTEHMIDHIFVPTSWTITGFEIGDVATWGSRSDHMPLVADVEPDLA